MNNWAQATFQAHLAARGSARTRFPMWSWDLTPRSSAREPRSAPRSVAVLRLQSPPPRHQQPGERSELPGAGERGARRLLGASAGAPRMGPPAWATLVASGDGSTVARLAWSRQHRPAR